MSDIYSGDCEIFEDVGTATNVQDYFQSEHVQIDDPTPLELMTQSIPVDVSAAQFFPQKTDEYYVKDESLKERFDRLEWEVDQLHKDLEHETKNGDLGGEDELDMRELNEKIKDLSESITRTPKGIASFRPIDELTNFVKNFKFSKQERIDLELESRERDYIVNFNPEIAGSQLKIKELEMRITLLERVIGIDGIDPAESKNSRTGLPSNLFATSGTLIEALERLDYHLSLISQPRVLDEAISRISGSINSVEKLLELKRKLRAENGIDRTDGFNHGDLVSKDEQCIYIYNELVRLEPIAKLMPNIIARLQSLKEFHTEIARFSESMMVFRENQDELIELAEMTRAALESLTVTVNDNQRVILDNFEALTKKKLTD